MDMPNEKVLQALASAKTVEEIQSVLDSEGAELVYSGGKEAKPEGASPFGMDSKPEIEVEVGLESEGEEPESFSAFSKKALKKNMDKMKGDENGG